MVDLQWDTSNAGKFKSWMVVGASGTWDASLEHENFENVLILKDPLRFILTLKSPSDKSHISQFLSNPLRFIVTMKTADIKTNVSKFLEKKLPFDDIHALDLFDLEILNWDAPNYSKLSACMKAVTGDNFAELRRLLPVLKDDDDEDMHEWIDDGLMESILTTALSNKIPLEDCHHVFRAEPEMATLAVQNNPDAWHYVDAEALGVCPPPKRRRMSRIF